MLRLAKWNDCKDLGVPGYDCKTVACLLSCIAKVFSHAVKLCNAVYVCVVSILLMGKHCLQSVNIENTYSYLTLTTLQIEGAPSSHPEVNYNSEGETNKCEVCLRSSCT